MDQKNAVPSFVEWEKEGSYIDVLNHRLFVIDKGSSTETIAILHGFPSCSYDYYAVLFELSQKYRVVVHDHPGFGLSAKKVDYSYSLIEQADVALALWEHLGLNEIHLLAHDYGTSIATELIARMELGQLNIKLSSITLGNGSMLIEMSKLLWTQKLLRTKTWGPLLSRFSSKPIFTNNFTKLWADKSLINKKEFDVLWDMLIHNEGRKVLPIIARYTFERTKFWHRWIGALEKTDAHINLYWADKDPVAVFAMASVLQNKIKNSSLKVLKNVGHYPMLEAPSQFAEIVLEGIKRSTKK